MSHNMTTLVSTAAPTTMFDSTDNLMKLVILLFLALFTFAGPMAIMVQIFRVGPETCAPRPAFVTSTTPVTGPQTIREMASDQPGTAPTDHLVCSAPQAARRKMRRVFVPTPMRTLLKPIPLGLRMTKCKPRDDVQHIVGPLPRGFKAFPASESLAEERLRIKNGLLSVSEKRKYRMHELEKKWKLGLGKRQAEEDGTARKRIKVCA